MSTDGNRQTPEKVKIDPEHGLRGKNDNYPGCTAKFVNGVRKRRKANKAAAAARKKNRSK